ncbi:hypothetical protein PR202_gb00862 [Eleusine coracana subsp. coracana]|uniref:Pre-rRNA-processing protein RIX1 N-terminal domain-containing protein n=1 Tax=Eleusine coracana subsp. coracana TaxID=191504 RepID=A0AAV5DVC6_ELECO|nr:hypothetical protein PR202_gb00862 [Eleusine coracana subsp. coracana]
MLRDPIYQTVPRLLKALVAERLPQPGGSELPPAEVASILNAVRTHGLLSESLPGHPPDPKLADAWRAAVNAWVERLGALVESDSVYCRWLGTCFLGITFQECCNERFAESYSTWFEMILSNLQGPSSLQLVTAISCTSMSDLFVRLAKFVNLKKEASSFAGRVVEPVLLLINENASVVDEAIDLLMTVIKLYPSSVNRHYSKVESSIAGMVLSTKVNGKSSEPFLPHAASIIRLMSEYFKVAKLPTVRTKVYSIAQLLLISLGVGTSLHLLEAVVSNSIADLNDGSENDMTMSSTHPSKVTTESASKSYSKKRKHDPQMQNSVYSASEKTTMSPRKKKGKLEIGTKLAEFCSHALLALDVLTHPRALSLERAAPSGPGLNYGAAEAAVFGAERYKLSSSGDLPQAMEVEDMYDDWFASKDDEPIEAQLNGDAVGINTAAMGSNHDRQLTPIPEDPKIDPPKITDAVRDVQASSKSDAKMVDAATGETVPLNMMDNPSSSDAVSTPVYTSNSDPQNHVISSSPEQKPTYGISHLENKSLAVDASLSKLATSNENSAAPDSGVESDSEDSMPEIQDGDPDSD